MKAVEVNSLAGIVQPPFHRMDTPILQLDLSSFVEEQQAKANSEVMDDIYARPFHVVEVGSGILRSVPQARPSVQF